MKVQNRYEVGVGRQSDIFELMTCSPGAVLPKLFTFCHVYTLLHSNVAPKDYRANMLRQHVATVTVYVDSCQHSPNAATCHTDRVALFSLFALSLSFISFILTFVVAARNGTDWWTKLNINFIRNMHNKLNYCALHYLSDWARNSAHNLRVPRSKVSACVCVRFGFDAVVLWKSFYCNLYIFLYVCICVFVCCAFASVCAC